MIDRGLVLTLVVMAAGLWALARLAPPRSTSRSELFDYVSPPVFAGMAAARLTAVGLDDPSALGRLRDLLLVRGGMELWAGIVAGSMTVVVARRRRGAGNVPAVTPLADLAPYALWAVAIYEATCVVRDGCFGPASSLGLHPAGVGYRQLPVGLVVGAAVAALAVLVRHLAASDPYAALVAAIGGLAAVRSAAAFWLPRISEGLTRPHRQSLAVLGVSVVVGTALLVVRLLPRNEAPGSYSE